MDHDQGACLRCGEPAGDQRFCESCRSQLDPSAESGSGDAADAGAALRSSVQARREVRLEQAAGADLRPAERLTIDVRGSLSVDARGGAFELEWVSSGPDERLSERAQPPREVARFEDVLAPATADADRVLAAYRWADAAGDAQGSTNLGVLLEQRGDLEGAIAAYRRGDERGDVNGSFNLGCLLAELGDAAGAQVALQRADERGDGAGASNLGLLLERQGDLDGALAAYRRADERGDAYGSFNLGLLLAGRGDLPGARDAYRRAAHRGGAEVLECAARAEADAITAADVTAEATAEPVALMPGEAPRVYARADDMGSVARDSMGRRARPDWVAAVSVLALVGLVALVARRGLRRFH